MIFFHLMALVTLKGNTHTNIAKKPSNCENCYYFVPDVYYNELGHCKLFKEFANVCRSRSYQCGVNGTHWKQIPRYIKHID